MTDIQQANPFLTIRARFFDEDRMYQRLMRYAVEENHPETRKALAYMKERHQGQFRKTGKLRTEAIPYINHPLLMACQAHALGVRDDALLASILLHDVVEDTGVTSQELPFPEEIRELVSLVSFDKNTSLDRHTAKAEYYARIAQNPKACIIKIIDRCNNVSTMAGVFPREKLISYVEETEEFVIPLTEVLKDMPEYTDMTFVIKYQIISLVEAVKCLLND